jgi:hypothetical protein
MIGAALVPGSAAPISTPSPTSPVQVGADIPTINYDNSLAAIDFHTRRLLMPRDGAIIFGDLDGKLDVLAVACDKCGRVGRYSLQRLIDDRGRNGHVIDWLDGLTAECPKKIAHLYE